jgi:hypothetical protein
LLTPDIAILEGQQQKKAITTFKVRPREFVTVLGLAGWPFQPNGELAAAWLHCSFDPYFNGKKCKAN